MVQNYVIIINNNLLIINNYSYYYYSYDNVYFNLLLLFILLNINGVVKVRIILYNIRSIMNLININININIRGVDTFNLLKLLMIITSLVLQLHKNFNHMVSYK